MAGPPFEAKFNRAWIIWKSRVPVQAATQYQPRPKGRGRSSICLKLSLDDFALPRWDLLRYGFCRGPRPKRQRSGQCPAACTCGCSRLSAP